LKPQSYYKRQRYNFYEKVEFGLSWLSELFGLFLLLEEQLFMGLVRLTLPLHLAIFRTEFVFRLLKFGRIWRHLRHLLTSRHRYLLRQAVEHQLISPFSEILFGQQLCNLRLRVLFELS
jgi:hypothetical protein